MAERALWAGPGVRLPDGAVGVVELALHPGGYVRFGDDEYVLVAHPRAPRGPLSLLVTGLHATPLRPGDRAEVVGDELRVGTLRIALAERSISARQAQKSITRPPAAPAHLASPGAAPARPAAPPVAAPARRRAALVNLKVPGTFRFAAPPAALVPGLRALAAGDLDAAVAHLAGRGEGLTPAGDDVLAGYAAARHAAGRPVALDASRCSPLGRAYLRCAERGELPEDLARWGATSGFAMLWGMKAAA